MQGLMMDAPLLVSSMIDYAAESHDGREVPRHPSGPEKFQWKELSYE